ncbi:MAG TPA: iron-sulfur cluster assembly accessory protein [Chromatiales bacterium]|nr:iron-sulfur cluster assembly accessory protein [Chromatiales bacterium]
MSVNNANPVENEQPVTLTEAAAAHVRKLIEQRGSGRGIRLGVSAMGCSGFGYVLDIVDEPNPEDRVFPAGGDLIVVVGPEAYPYVKGTRIDFVREGLNRSFKFDNPNVQATCGCGESFAV